ncbi:hypothetical protein LCGC14_0364180 [marine sediment metagenome]|uniref:Uncharacterized protein n=1 Tax=marine sediment metagenome TaxID=412755 RepID=A0A0F9TCX5_9ZZZZ
MVALTTVLARTQLSRDTGDFFTSAATSTGNTTTFTDSLLANYDDDIFVTKFITWLKVTSGTDTGLSRRITGKVNGLVTHIALPNGVASSDTYEIHRLAIPDEKDDAITHALNLLNGTILFKKAQAEFTLVADQFDYDVPSGFYRDQLRQVHLVSAGDTEVSREVFDWEIRVDSGGGNDIHFFSRLQAGETIRVFGHQVVVLGDLVDGEGFALILSARAAMHIYDTIVNQAPVEDIARYQLLLGRATALYGERLTKFVEIGIPATARSEAYRAATIGLDFSI